MTQKYRKKPVVIEAVQMPSPQLWDAYNQGHTADAQPMIQLGLFIEEAEWVQVQEGIQIQTTEGVMLASPGDWIIKGVKGEFYPCKPDIFELTYDLVPFEES